MDKILLFSILISLVGILILLLISANLPIREVKEYSQLKEGEYVQIAGKIISVKNYQDFSIIRLDKNITLTCECNLKANQTLEAAGYVESYKGELQINTEKIKIKNK